MAGKLIIAPACYGTSKVARIASWLRPLKIGGRKIGVAPEY